MTALQYKNITAVKYCWSGNQLIWH